MRERMDTGYWLAFGEFPYLFPLATFCKAKKSYFLDTLDSIKFNSNQFIFFFALGIVILLQINLERRNGLELAVAKLVVWPGRSTIVIFCHPNPHC